MHALRNLGPEASEGKCALSFQYGSTSDNPKQRGDFKESADSVLSLLFAQVSDAINTRAFNFGEFVDGRAQQPMPKSLAPNEADLSRFADLCHGLCIKLLKLFALGLNVGTVQILIGGDVHCLSDDRSIRTTAERIGFPPAMIPQKVRPEALSGCYMCDRISLLASPPLHRLIISSTPPSKRPPPTTMRQSTSAPEHTATTAP